jgi:hypothetical protein
MKVRKSDVRFLPDARRVITKPFSPGLGLSADGRTRTQRIIERILSLPESVVVSTLGAAQLFAARATST